MHTSIHPSIVGFCTCANSDKHGEVPESTVFCSLFKSAFSSFVFAKKHPAKPSSEARVLEVFRLEPRGAMLWGGGDRSQQDLWSALVAVAEADIEDIEFLMVRLQDSDLEKIRQATQAALVASSRLQAAEREAASSNDNRAQAGPKAVAKGATDTAQVAPAASATAAGSPATVAPSREGYRCSLQEGEQLKAAPPGPTFAKDTSPGAAAAAKAMTAPPVPVKPLPAGPGSQSSTSPPTTTTPAKKTTPVKCPPKVPDPPTAPPGPTSAEDAIGVVYYPSSYLAACLYRADGQGDARPGRRRSAEAGREGCSGFKFGRPSAAW